MIRAEIASEIIRLVPGSSLFSFLAVDQNLRLIEYGAVEWSQIRDADSPQFYPQFLHPIHSILAPGELCSHLTHQGDLILMDRNGLLAARRRRKWKLYDTPTFTDSLAYTTMLSSIARLLPVPIPILSNPSENGRWGCRGTGRLTGRCLGVEKDRRHRHWPSRRCRLAIRLSRSRSLRPRPAAPLGLHEGTSAAQFRPPEWLNS